MESALEELGKLDSVEGATTLAGFQQALDNALSAYMGRSGATGTGVFRGRAWGRNRNGI